MKEHVEVWFNKQNIFWNGVTVNVDTSGVLTVKDSKTGRTLAIFRNWDCVIIKETSDAP